tara:strand:+ start:118 stop:348 length:231 start_codon:yes stop_codon:yes gene_type:complete
MAVMVAVQAAAVLVRVGVVIVRELLSMAVVAVVAVVEATERVGAGQVVDERVKAVDEMVAVVVSTAADALVVMKDL